MFNSGNTNTADASSYSTAELTRVEYSTDTFRMFCFKVRPGRRVGRRWWPGGWVRRGRSCCCCSPAKHRHARAWAPLPLCLPLPPRPPLPPALACRRCCAAPSATRTTGAPAPLRTRQRTRAAATPESSSTARWPAPTTSRACASGAPPPIMPLRLQASHAPSSRPDLTLRRHRRGAPAPRLQGRRLPCCGAAPTQPAAPSTSSCRRSTLGGRLCRRAQGAPCLPRAQGRRLPLLARRLRGLAAPLQVQDAAVQGRQQLPQAGVLLCARHGGAALAHLQLRAGPGGGRRGGGPGAAAARRPARLRLRAPGPPAGGRARRADAGRQRRRLGLHVPGRPFRGRLRRRHRGQLCSRLGHAGRGRRAGGPAAHAKAQGQRLVGGVAGRRAQRPGAGARRCCATTPHVPAGAAGCCARCGAAAPPPASVKLWLSGAAPAKQGPALPPGLLSPACCTLAQVSSGPLAGASGSGPHSGPLSGAAAQPQPHALVPQAHYAMYAAPPVAPAALGMPAPRMSNAFARKHGLDPKDDPLVNLQKITFQAQVVSGRRAWGRRRRSCAAGLPGSPPAVRNPCQPASREQVAVEVTWLGWGGGGACAGGG
jgi:hypothetical protein